jgi:hypothetical protein
MSARPYPDLDSSQSDSDHSSDSDPDYSSHQGLTLVHLSAQRTHF